MKVFSPGHLSESRSLDDLLRSVHESEREAINRSLAERRENDTPASEHEEAPDAQNVDDIGPFPAYPEQEDYRQVMVRLRSVPDRVRREHIAIQSSLVWKSDDKKEELSRKTAGQVEQQRSFVSQAVGEVSGLEDEEGRPLILGSPEWTKDHLDIVEANGLLLSLSRVAMHFAGLNGERRGNFGASQPSTSETSTATHAQDSVGPNGDATSPPLNGTATTSRTPATSHGGAPSRT